ncbi:MAG: YceI family protein [Candidatus Zixiibacteriota bacterium]
MLKKCVTTLALVALTATMVHAEPLTYNLDAAHSVIGFSVRHMAISKVRGNFNEFEGSFTIDPQDSSSWSGQITIQTASIDTDNEKRDEHLRSADFFNADSFPTITFESTKITPKGNNEFEVQGNLTMRGVTKPVTLKAEVTGTTMDPWGNERIGIELTGTIDRMDYGVSWNNMLETGGLVVSHEVDLELDVQGVRKVE